MATLRKMKEIEGYINWNNSYIYLRYSGSKNDSLSEFSHLLDLGIVDTLNKKFYKIEWIR